MTTLHEAAQKAIYWLDQNGGAHIADELRDALAQQGEPCDMGQMCLNCQPRGPNGECPDKAAPAAQPTIPSNSGELKPLRTKTLDKSKWVNDLKDGAVMGNHSEPADESVLEPQAQPLTCDAEVSGLSTRPPG